MLVSSHEELDPREVNVRLVLDKVALGQVFLQASRFFDVRNIPSVLHTHFYLNATLIRRSSTAWEIFKAMLCWISGSTGPKNKHFHIVFFPLHCGILAQYTSQLSILLPSCLYEKDGWAMPRNLQSSIFQLPCYHPVIIVVSLSLSLSLSLWFQTYTRFIPHSAYLCPYFQDINEMDFYINYI